MFGVKTFRSATPSLFPPFPTSITYVLPSVYYIRPARGLGGSFFPLSHLAAKITKHVKVNKHGRCSKEARKAEFILYPGWVLVNMSPNARFMNWQTDKRHGLVDWSCKYSLPDLLSSCVLNLTRMENEAQSLVIKKVCDENRAGTRKTTKFHKLRRII